MEKSYLNQTGLPLGLRNNNPGNLVFSGDRWQGMIGTNGRFVVFSNIVFGIRALARDIEGDITKDGDNTIEKLITSFAPPFENDTEAYIRYVSQVTGISRNQTITADGSTLQKIIRAIINKEIGPGYSSRYIDDADITKGIQLSNPNISFAAAAGGGILLLIGTAAAIYFLTQNDN